MKLRVYNTLSNKVEDFEPINKNSVGFYTCGPTVYDYAHIGNFRSYIVEDMVKRYLLYLGYNVDHVMNITDIDDKTIRKSNELGVELRDVTDKYIRAFIEDKKTLNIVPADRYPRATDHIEEMEDMIQTLIDGGYAYEKGGSVYFSIEKFPEYGVLANIEKENLKSGVSVDADEYDKNSVQDFVLWKGAKEGEPFWNSRFGKGRPGWHIECSAMSIKYLGNHFDIHMGGVDNIFPHHDNEIAQTECCTGEKFVNYWLHCQHLVVENKKMSKSLGNFYTLRQLMDMGYNPMAIRYLLISSHYRKLLNFTLEGLEAADKSLKRISDFIFSVKGLSAEEGTTSEAAGIIEESEEAFRKCMNDDFNISGGLGSFFEFIHKINRILPELKAGDIENVLSFVERINSVLGVIIKEEEAESLDEKVEEMIRLRGEARKNRDFKTADEIRDKLKDMGIVLIDTPEGVRWKKES